MTDALSKTQIDKLGERLKTGEPSETDLRMLDAYRRSFMVPYEFVLGVVRDKLNLEPTGRPAKSTTAIREKLRRESIRLSQMQDIAGCRVVVGNLMDQDSIVSALTAEFLNSDIVDRRERPSHGYRAVHVIVRRDDKAIEIQVRTALQQLWAELSEKAANVIDSALKYGSGPDDVLTLLMKSSGVIASFEILEPVIYEMGNSIKSDEGLSERLLKRVEDLRATSNSERSKIRMLLEDTLTIFTRR